MVLTLELRVFFTSYSLKNLKNVALDESVARREKLRVEQP